MPAFFECACFFVKGGFHCWCSTYCVDVSQQAATPDGATPLHLACQRASPGVVRLLVAVCSKGDGALLGARTAGGLRALDIAVLRGNLPSVNALLSAGAAQDGSLVGGNTLLHAALYLGNFDIASCLHASDGERALTARNDHGRTPSEVLRLNYRTSWSALAKYVPENAGGVTSTGILEQSNIDQIAAAAFTAQATRNTAGELELSLDDFAAYFSSRDCVELRQRFWDSSELQMVIDLQVERIALLKSLGPRLRTIAEPDFVQWHRQFHELQRLMPQVSSGLPAEIQAVGPPQLLVVPSVQEAKHAAAAARSSSAEPAGKAHKTVAELAPAAMATLMSVKGTATPKAVETAVLQALAADDPEALVHALVNDGHSIFGSIAAEDSPTLTMSFSCAAAFCGSAKIVAILATLTARAACDGADALSIWMATSASDGSTALMHACAAGDVHLADAVLHEGSPPTEFINATTNASGVSAVYLAAYGGHVAVLKRLLSIPGTNIDTPAVPRRITSSSAPEKTHATPLFVASQEGHAEVVRLLVHGGSVDVNLQCPEDGATPLHIAVARGHVDVVKILLQESSVVATQAKYGRTPLLDAVLSGSVAMVQTLVEKGELPHQVGLVPVSQLHLDYGVRSETEPNAACAYGMSSIMLAVVGLDFDVVELLAEQQQQQQQGAHESAHACAFGHTWQQLVALLHAGMSWDELSILRHTIDLHAVEAEADANTVVADGVFSKFCDDGSGQISRIGFFAAMSAPFATGGLDLALLYGEYFHVFVDVLWAQLQTWIRGVPRSTTVLTPAQSSSTRQSFASWYAKCFCPKLEILFVTNGRPVDNPDPDALVAAAESDDYLAVRRCVAHMKTPVDAKLDGFTPLM